MLLALEQAKLAAALGEVPIGAAIVKNDQVIAQSFNQVESLNEATAHAEILAIRSASRILNNWRLEGCTLYVTLEPCPMCFAAIRLARLQKVIIGASESRMGISRFPDLVSDTNLGPKPEILEGILKEDCSLILKEFFNRLRK